MESSVLDNIKQGPLGKLYNPDNILSDKQGSGGTYAGGKYCTKESYIESILNRIRKESESCNLLGFQVVNSLGGGTGSGLGYFLTQLINLKLKLLLSFLKNSVHL